MGCGEVVRQKWVINKMQPDPIMRVKSLLKKCGGEMARWAKGKDKDRLKNIDVLTRQIKELKEAEGLQYSARIKDMKRERGILLEQEDISGNKG